MYGVSCHLQSYKYQFPLMQNIIDVNFKISNTLIENPYVSNLAIYNS